MPAERDLMTRFGVSRATLREALRILAEHELLEARPGVGWFVRQPGKRALTAVTVLRRPIAPAWQPIHSRRGNPRRAAAPDRRRRETLAHPQPANRPPGDLRVHLVVGARQGAGRSGAGGRRGRTRNEVSRASR